MSAKKRKSIKLEVGCGAGDRRADYDVRHEAVHHHTATVSAINTDTNSKPSLTVKTTW